MAKKPGIIITTLCLILLFTLPASAAVYTWKDKDGNTVVSSSPPEATSQKSDKAAAQAGEDIPTGKRQDSTLGSKENVPSRSREGAQPGQKEVSRQQGRGPASSNEIFDAAKNGDVKKVKALLKRSPDLVSSKNDRSMTPLHEAAMKGHKDVAKLLLANKADVNVKDNCGATPLRHALEGREGASKLMGKDAFDLVFPDKPGLKGNLKETAELLRQHGGRK